MRAAASPVSAREGGDRSGTSPPVVGIVGGIGSGKSEVARMLADAGGRVVDADRIVHEKLATAAVTEQIRDRFGDDVLTPEGAVDRARLGKRVFDDPDALADLERILHPEVVEEIDRRLVRLAREPDVRCIVLDVPLLMESGLDRRCDAVIFVDADAEVRWQRIGASRGWSREEARRREKFQKPLSAKKERADYRVDNNQPTDRVRPVVQAILDEIAGSTPIR